MALHYFKRACQISRILPMYVSHLLHQYTSAYFGSSEKRLQWGERVTACKLTPGWTAVGTSVVVGTSEPRAT